MPVSSEKLNNSIYQTESFCFTNQTCLKINKIHLCYHKHKPMTYVQISLQLQKLWVKLLFQTSQGHPCKCLFLFRKPNILKIFTFYFKLNLGTLKEHNVLTQASSSHISSNQNRTAPSSKF